MELHHFVAEMRWTGFSPKIIYPAYNVYSFQDNADESEEEDEWVEKVSDTSEPFADKTCETVTGGKSHLGPSQVEYGLKTDVLQEKQGTVCFLFWTWVFLVGWHQGYTPKNNSARVVQYRLLGWRKWVQIMIWSHLHYWTIVLHFKCRV
jgi:hypothetical protein